MNKKAVLYNIAFFITNIRVSEIERFVINCFVSKFGTIILKVKNKFMKIRNRFSLYDHYTFSINQK